MPPVEIGDVYAVAHEGIDHEKYIVVLGITELGTFLCCVFINSKINGFIVNKKPHLVPFHIPITQNKNRFLHHNSFVACDQYHQVPVQKLEELHEKGMCRPLGKLDESDFVLAKKALVDSELLSPEELKFYLQIPIE